MIPSGDTSASPGMLGKYTPDSRRWRLRVAGLTAIGAPLAFYGAFAVASGVKSGLIYNLLILLFGVIALVFPAVAAIALLAPDSGLSRANPSESHDSVEMLKQQYATSEIDQAEFNRRLNDLMETPESTHAEGSTDQGTNTLGSDQQRSEKNLDRAGQ